MLAKYLSRTQALVSDLSSQFWSQSLLTNFINEARGQIAAAGQCVRVLPPSTNGITSITVTNGGIGYLTAPTVMITGYGSGATASCTLSGTSVNTVTVLTAGTGYDNSTTIGFTSASGAGAKASPVIKCLNTVAGQEIYTYAAANPLAQLTAGVDSILFVRTVAVAWGALKPVLQQKEWGWLQAFVRAYPLLSGQPSMWAQYAQGESGSMFIQPVPTQALGMDWDCVCTPIDLALDSDPEAIPYPWTDAVPYFAAYLAFMNARRPEEAKNMYGIFNDHMLNARATSEPGFIPSYYD